MARGRDGKRALAREAIRGIRPWAGHCSSDAGEGLSRLSGMELYKTQPPEARVSWSTPHQNDARCPRPGQGDGGGLEIGGDLWHHQSRLEDVFGRKDRGSLSGGLHRSSGQSHLPRPPRGLSTTLGLPGKVESRGVAYCVHFKAITLCGGASARGDAPSTPLHLPAEDRMPLAGETMAVP